ncbi:L-ascorbate metabolism protein UlaG, beta-lactamase superfamily [Butyrivibrio sp. ob235]|uniref:MBL fold metallo-hydrolase n=1 Tax=Butyrivibrio sp. ob235 TaxID=1761780 RepID=UPI0008C90556|nr:MBL fold metallo-hydrolase [Butyrivibrio sp. ob235]SEK25917.1 L-ascorbate metabolism protein UlaG, beta-lactamase superfamily [Butyrivibrio sp. ob235]
MVENIEVLTHSSIRINSDKGVIYVDPFEIKDAPHDADYIFITHDHYDHFSPDDIKKIIKSDTRIVAPEKIASKAEVLLMENGKVLGVKPKIYKEFDGLEFETVPAYNNLKPFHPKAAGYVGYIFRIDHKRIYVAGDTSLTKDAQQVRCDIALVPIGGKYTMNAQKAAELVNIIRPEVAIPTHYGNIVGSPSDAKVFKSNVDSHIKVEIKIH